jgi:hypothetical protein
MVRCTSQARLGPIRFNYTPSSMSSLIHNASLLGDPSGGWNPERLPLTATGLYRHLQVHFGSSRRRRRNKISKYPKGGTDGGNVGVPVLSDIDTIMTASWLLVNGCCDDFERNMDRRIWLFHLVEDKTHYNHKRWNTSTSYASSISMSGQKSTGAEAWAKHAP